MADVLLINIPFHAKGMPRIMPIQFAALGGRLLEHGHRVRVLDLNREPDEKLDDVLGRERFDAVGLCYRNVLPMFWLERFRSLRRMIVRLRRHGITPVVGGPGFSLFHPLIFQRVPELQVGALGEGEETICRFAAGESWSTIPGLCFRTEDGFRSNYPPRFLPGEQIPLFRELPGLEYDDPSYLVGLQTYRGCRYSCAYCPTEYLRGDTQRLRPLEHVERDLLFLCRKNIRHVMIIDGVFNEPRERSLALAELFQKLAFPESWEGFLKPRADLDEETVARFAHAGAIRFHIDIIAGTDRLAPSVGHDLHIRDAFRAAELLKKHDIEGVFYFAYQLPDERLRDETETFGYLRRLRRVGQRTFIYPFFPYPGTRFAELYGNILRRSVFWHARRLLSMMLRPSFFAFLKNMLTLTEMTGPRRLPRQGRTAE